MNTECSSRAVSVSTRAEVSARHCAARRRRATGAAPSFGRHHSSRRFTTARSPVLASLVRLDVSGAPWVDDDLAARLKALAAMREFVNKRGGRMFQAK